MEINVVNNVIEITPQPTTIIEINSSPVPIKGDQGEQGLSAYAVAVENGFIGSESEWLDSLKTNIIEWNSTNW